MLVNYRVLAGITKRSASVVARCIPKNTRNKASLCPRPLEGQDNDVGRELARDSKA